MNESAFAVNVPEAESTVSRWREEHDPSAALGVPAHVTVLYPFMPPADISGEVVERVQAALLPLSPFRFRLRAVARFPNVLYLAPEPAQPFLALTAALTAAFPTFLPYAGRYAGVIPHLTVAQGDESLLDQLEPRLRAALPAGGIAATCRRLAWIENSSGRWRPLHGIGLGPAPAVRAEPRLPPEFEAFWRAGERVQPQLDRSRFLEAFAFGDSEPLAGALAALVLSGAKRATASLAWTYEAEHKPVPQPGDLSIVTSWHRQALCIIQTTAVEVVPFEAVSADFAAAEGEGDASLASWQRNHAEFFGRECARIGRTPHPRMPVVCEHFRVIHRPGATTTGS